MYEHKFINVRLFLRYTECKIIENTEETLYRSYVCDGIKAILENLARTNGGEHLTDRYFDLICELGEPEKTTSKEKEKEKEKSELTADRIIAETMANCGLKLKDK